MLVGAICPWWAGWWKKGYGGSWWYACWYLVSRVDNYEGNEKFQQKYNDYCNANYAVEPAGKNDFDYLLHLLLLLFFFFFFFFLNNLRIVGLTNALYLFSGDKPHPSPSPRPSTTSRSVRRCPYAYEAMPLFGSAIKHQGVLLLLFV